MNINKIFYLGTCSTCKEIIKSIKDTSDFKLVDIKKKAITSEELDELYLQTGSYEALFSKRSRSYAAIKDTIKKDEDYRDLILRDYTFLKRPVIQYKNHLFIGNSPSTKDAIKKTLG